MWIEPNFPKQGTTHNCPQKFITTHNNPQRSKKKFLNIHNDQELSEQTHSHPQRPKTIHKNQSKQTTMTLKDPNYLATTHSNP